MSGGNTWDEWKDDEYISDREACYKLYPGVEDVIASGDCIDEPTSILCGDNSDYQKI
jgi:hypothetical protein